jgi:hypothetical protein
MFFLNFDKAPNEIKCIFSLFDGSLFLFARLY